MEEPDSDPEKQSLVLSKNQDSKMRVSTQKVEESKTREEETEKGQKNIFSQLRDQKTLLTNIPIAADARVQRARLDIAKITRAKLLENDVKSSQDKYEEITRGWTVVNQKVKPQELQKALDAQQELCGAFIEDKKKLISDLQQELKMKDKSYVKNLKKNTEEVGLMLERMSDQIQILTQACREEVDQTERIHQHEISVGLTKDMAEWEQHLKELWDKELERLKERKKKVEMYEKEFTNIALAMFHNENTRLQQKIAINQANLRKCEEAKDDNKLLKLKQRQRSEEYKKLQFTMTNCKMRISSLELEIKTLKRVYTKEEKDFRKQTHMLSEDCRRHDQKYKRTHVKFKHFAKLDPRNFEKMRLMIEAEMKELVERALAIDKLICIEHLGLTWKRPNLPFLELSVPIQLQKQSSRLGQPFQTENCSLETDTESPQRELYKEGEVSQQESSPEWEEGTLSEETLKKVMELLCDEMDFLMEDDVSKTLSSLDKDRQTVMKCVSLCRSLGIDKEDVPKLVDFLLKNEQQQREQIKDAYLECSSIAEGMEDRPTTNSTSDLIHPNHVLPALKSFFEQRRRSRESGAKELSTLWTAQARVSSEDQRYWDSLVNIIPEDKVNLWDEAEKTLTHSHAVLRRMSDLIPETEHLKQQNIVLRKHLYQRSTSFSVRTNGNARGTSYSYRY